MVSKLTWAEVSKFDNNPPTYVVPREPEVQIIYTEHLQKRKDDGISICDYISKYVLGEDNNIALTINQFPYALEAGIQHLILWMRTGFELNTDDARTYIASKTGSSREKIVLFQNLPNNRSINGLPHYQVFIHE